MRFRKAFVCALLLSATFVGCGDDELSIGGGGTPFNPNRQPPGKYTQAPSFIPSSLNDPLFSAAAPWGAPPLSYLWGFADVNVFGQYSGLTLPADDLIVAVIDTGVDKDHEDLAGRLWVNALEGNDERYANGVDDDGDGFVDDFIGWDFANDTNNPADDSGHGTHVAGTIGAVGGNGVGIVGVAPWVRIMPLKVCGAQGTCSSADIRAAMAYAVAHGAKIINLSLGAFNQGADSTAFDGAIREATEAGTLVFAASGNYNIDAEYMTPANATFAVAVGAHRSDGAKCSFSDYGWKVDLSGPGCALDGEDEVSGVLSLNSRKCGLSGDQYCSRRQVVEGYTLKQGTSMSTPHAVGMAAVAWTASPGATPLQIRQALLRTARAPVAGSRNFNFGAGKLSGPDLVTEARTAPGIKITSPRYGVSANLHTIGVRIEARARDVSWSLRYVPDTGTPNLDLSTGTAIGTGGSVSADSSADFSVEFTPPSSGGYLVILEAEAGGEKYYDVSLLRRP